jgi:heat shock protein HslJ
MPSRKLSIFILIFSLLMLASVSSVLGQSMDELTGTQWQLVSMAGEPAIEGTAVTLNFGVEGSAGGAAGCNSYGATYTTDGTSITFSEVFSTMMACLDEALMEQETIYLMALQTAAAYEMTEAQLIITYGEGEQLVFERGVTLAGTAWQLTMLGSDPALEAVSVMLQFDTANGVTGSGGCNSYSSTYTVNGGAIAFADVVSTKMACVDEAAMGQESAFFAALATATEYGLDGDQLTILYGEGEAMVFTQLAMLAGTAWELQSYGGTEVVAGSTVTLQFTDETQVLGSGGCNSYGGSYTVDGERITFNEIASTEMACLEDGVMAQESVFYAALAAATTYERTDSQLIITYGEGEQLVFTEAATVSSSA